jgi:hypothetical protein
MGTPVVFMQYKAARCVSYDDDEDDNDAQLAPQANLKDFY